MRILELITATIADKIAEVTTGISARDALLADPLTVEMEKLGIRHADMGHIVQRAARLEAHGITARDVDRIVRQWYRDAAETERTAQPEGDE